MKEVILCIVNIQGIYSKLNHYEEVLLKAPTVYPHVSQPPKNLKVKVSHLHPTTKDIRIGMC